MSLQCSHWLHLKPIPYRKVLGLEFSSFTPSVELGGCLPDTLRDIVTVPFSYAEENGCPKILLEVFGKLREEEEGCLPSNHF